MKEDLTIFYKPIDQEKNGSFYLKQAQIDLPLRIYNMIKEENYSSEEEFYNELRKIILEHTSYYLFPNTLCSFYPKVVEQKASKELTCFLSGAAIKPNESYYRYRPILENLETGKVYTITQTIIASLAYIDYFPSTLFEFESWAQKIEQTEYYTDDKIDFYNFSCLAGDNCLYLKEFKKDKERQRQRSTRKKIKELEKTKLELIKIQDTAMNNNDIEKKLIRIEKRIQKLKEG